MMETSSSSPWAKIARRLVFGRCREYLPEDLPRPALVFAPHQDDETLGCGGTIIKKRAAGAEVALVFLADGGTSHENLMGTAEMAALREQEAAAAAGVLGIRPRDITFFRYPNRHVQDHFEESVARAEALLEKHRPAEVFVPYHGDPPADHIATRHTALAAVRRHGRPVTIYEFPIWFWEHWPWMPATVYAPRPGRSFAKHSLRSWSLLLGDFHCRSKIGDVLDKKFLALREHKSQMTRLRDDPGWATLSDVGEGDFLSCFFQDFEIFFKHSWPR